MTAFDPAPLLTERDARLLLSRIAEPYDEKVQGLVATHGVTDLVGYAIRDGRTPDGVSLERLRARLPRAQGVDEAQICRALGLTVLLPGHEGWPAALDDLPDPPWCLWVRGPVLPQEWQTWWDGRAAHPTSTTKPVAASECHPIGVYQLNIRVASGLPRGDALLHIAGASRDAVLEVN